MKIIKNDEKLILNWTYNIKNNKVIKKDKEYYYYTSIFPIELYNYFNQDYLYLYESDDQYYFTKEIPPTDYYMKVKLITKNRYGYSKEITLSKKFFKFLDGYIDGSVDYLFHIDENDYNDHRGKLELRFNII